MRYEPVYVMELLREFLDLVGDFWCLDPDEVYLRLWKELANVTYLIAKKPWKLSRIFEVVKLYT